MSELSSAQWHVEAFFEWPCNCLKLQNPRTINMLFERVVTYQYLTPFKNSNSNQREHYNSTLELLLTVLARILPDGERGPSRSSSDCVSSLFPIWSIIRSFSWPWNEQFYMMDSEAAQQRQSWVRAHIFGLIGQIHKWFLKYTHHRTRSLEWRPVIGIGVSQNRHLLCRAFNNLFHLPQGVSKPCTCLPLRSRGCFLFPDLAQQVRMMMMISVMIMCQVPWRSPPPRIFSCTYIRTVRLWLWIVQQKRHGLIPFPLGPIDKVGTQDARFWTFHLSMYFWERISEYRPFPPGFSTWNTNRWYKAPYLSSFTTSIDTKRHTTYVWATNNYCGLVPEAWVEVSSVCAV